MNANELPTVDGTEPTEVGSVFISNYPPYSFWSAERVPDALAALERPASPETPLGLYVHIPFCRVRCRFCYYKVYTDKDSSQVRSYLDGVTREIRLLAERPAVAGRPLKFVYFGGGTPSFISSPDLAALAASIQEVLPWAGAEEITFECEPGTITRAKLEAIRAIGVTRLSLGVESFDDRILETNGRAHLSKEIERTLPWIREVGFRQVNLDLIAGMVGETWETWRGSVRKTIEAAPDSVTIYQLELPFNTLFSRGVLGGEGAAPPIADWTLKRAWHDYAFDELASAGYEISSAYTMVRKGRDARFVYRDAIWRGSDMIGAGVASFSHLDGVHFQNLAEWDAYLARIAEGRIPVERAFVTTPAERLVRETILQMKTGRLDGGYFRRKFGVEILERFEGPLRRLEEAGMLGIREDGVVLTRQGLLRVDQLLPELYAPEYRNARYT